MPAAMPIRIERMVHTGPNKPLGGANQGRCKVAYHVSIDPFVSRPESKPMAIVDTTAMAMRRSGDRAEVVADMV